MDVEEDAGELPDIDDDVVVKPSRPELESSPRPKPEEEKENETKPKTNSWLVFSGAGNLFEDDDEEAKSNSSVSLPNIPVSGENENENDDVVLQLDGSSFLDEHEAAKTQEELPTTIPSPKSDSEDTPVKKSKKKKSRYEEDDELPDIGDEASMDVEAESKIPKRLSKKELKKMHSDAQRVLREAPVSIPIRRAEPLNLDDILQEVASINSEVKKFIEKDEKKEKKNEEKPAENKDIDDLIVLGDDPTAELSNKAVKADDSDVELEIVDEVEAPPPPPVESKPINPGVAWLMQRFRRHHVAPKPQKNRDEEATTSATRWDDVKGHLQEEMAVLREKNLQDRIQRFKMENDEEIEPEPEEEEAEVDPGDNSEDDDSYTTISDDDESEETKRERKKKKDEKNRPSINVFLDKEAKEDGSDDEDYQPSEGHREEGGGSTDEGSIDSEDENVKSGSEDDSEDEEDDDEIDEDDEMETSDEEEKILRSSHKKKGLKKKHSSKKMTVESDDEEKDVDNKVNEDDLPELIVEDRPVMDDEEALFEKEPEKVNDAILEPSVTSISSVVMPPDMPRPKELFNIYNDPYGIAMMKGGEENNDNMDDLLGLCTGPFLPVPADKDDEDGSKLEEPQPVKKLKHVYGAKSKSTLKEDESDSEDDEEGPVGEEHDKVSKKDRRKLLREFFEDEAELSESDQEAGRVSADEDEGSSEDSYETDPEYEDEALAKLSAGQLQKQVESIHMKQVIDEDERDLLHLREAIIPDADLADAVGPRLRRFRWAEAWRDMGGSDLASQGENVHADDDYLGLAALDPAAGPSMSSMWQKQRVERERWLQNQQGEQPAADSQTTVILSAESESVINEKSGSDCQLVRLGISAMRKSSGSASVSFSAASNPSLLASDSSSVPRRVSHGSMLSWLQQKELDKIAQTVGSGNNSNASNQPKRRSGAAVTSHSAGGADPKPEDMMTASGFKSRSSAGPFIVMSEEASPGERKRKFEGAANSSASKRGKQQQSSVFDFLS